MNFANQLTDSLRKDIVDIPKVSWLFSKHLKIDFIRNRMIDFQFLLHFFICIQVGTLRYGLFKYFFYDLLHFQTLIQIIDSYDSSEAFTIFIADKGFHSFNVLAHIIGLLLRAKNVNM